MRFPFDSKNKLCAGRQCLRAPLCLCGELTSANLGIQEISTMLATPPNMENLTRGFYKEYNLLNVTYETELPAL